VNVQFEYDGPQAPKNGQTLLQLLIIGLFCFFALRLWYLQIHKGDYYASKALDNRLRQETLYAPRGLLLDRAGQLVAINEPAYALGLIREDCPDVEASLAQVSVWTGVPLVQLQKTVQKARYRVKPFEPLIIVPALSFEQLSAIESNALRWPGLEIIVRPKRFYPQSELLAHILGYVAEASEQDLETDDTLAMGDTVGKGGIENVLEARLRGEKGLRQLEVDAAGRRFQLRGHQGLARRRGLEAVHRPGPGAKRPTKPSRPRTPPARWSSSSPSPGRSWPWFRSRASTTTPLPPA